MAENKQSSLNLPGINAAIIMDGNGRWAKKNALNVTSGHEKGVEVVRKIVESAAKAQLESLSLYAFSTENWSRPKKEILGKMRCIYKIPGDRKEYLKHKGKLITVKEYKELMKAKLKKKEVKPKKVKKIKSKK